MNASATFRDQAHDATFAERGFVTMPLLDEQQLARLIAAWEANRHSEEAGYRVTLAEGERAVRQSASDAVVAVIDEPVRAVLADHRVALATFVVKGATGDSRVQPHTDPTLVDEPRVRSVAVWITTVDTSLENGALWVLDGSHRMTPAFRPATGFPQRELSDELVATHPQRQIPLPLPAGHAVFFDHALVHWSGPNESGRTRVAVAAVAAPARERLLCCVHTPRGHDERWAVPDDYILHRSEARPRQVGELIDRR
ncbi:MAG: hypothetical protein QOI95_2493 [Acidimicrobiaceae bacterium]|jgi:hypothetical protein